MIVINLPEDFANELADKFLATIWKFDPNYYEEHGGAMVCIYCGAVDSYKIKHRKDCIGVSILRILKGDEKIADEHLLSELTIKILKEKVASLELSMKQLQNKESFSDAIKNIDNVTK
jgi:hypothetical protein